MEETILNAIERPVQSRKFKEKGFVPGVLYGDNHAEATSVKFGTSDLTKILANHGSNAKVWVKYGDNKKFGFIKEIQRNRITRQVLHVDVYLVSQNQEVKMQLPISFKGKEALEQRILLLQIYKSEIDVFGKASVMPDLAVVNVSEKKLGDTITINDFALDKQLKICDREDEVYGIITHLKAQSAEAPAEDEPIKE
jgi:large subunit ribosomal protein L25